MKIYDKGGNGKASIYYQASPGSSTTAVAPFSSETFEDDTAVSSFTSGIASNKRCPCFDWRPDGDFDRRDRRREESIGERDLRDVPRWEPLSRVDRRRCDRGSASLRPVGDDVELLTGLFFFFDESRDRARRPLLPLRPRLRERRFRCGDFGRSRLRERRLRCRPAEDDREVEPSTNSSSLLRF